MAPWVRLILRGAEEEEGVGSADVAVAKVVKLDAAAETSLGAGIRETAVAVAVDCCVILLPRTHAPSFGRGSAATGRMSHFRKSVLVAIWIWAIFDGRIVALEIAEALEPAGKRFRTPAPPFVAYAHQRLEFES